MVTKWVVQDVRVYPELSEQGEEKLEVRTANTLSERWTSEPQSEQQPLDCYTLWIQLLKKVYAKSSLHNVTIHCRLKMQKCRGKEKTGAYPWPIIISGITLIQYILKVQFLSVNTLKNHNVQVLNYRNESLRITDSWSYKKNSYKNNITYDSTGLTMITTWKISTVNNEHDSASHLALFKNVIHYFVLHHE